MVDIHKIIAAINPDLYCDPSAKKDVKKILDDEFNKIDNRIKNKKKEEEKKGKQYKPTDSDFSTDVYLKAAEKAKPVESTFMDFEKIGLKNAFDAAGLKMPTEKHMLVYDAYGESLEPIYFWILDNLAIEYDANETEKLIDNFVSSPTSGHFAEVGQRATRMQDEAMKILGAVNNVIKSILNILYDLKEFEIRLEPYKMLREGNADEKKNALLSLKQIWMDTVDVKRGGTSIKGLALSGANQPNFVTLIDAFLAVENEKLEANGEKIDVNERVERILRQKISEFNIWLQKSEEELTKRYKVEKIYLKSQVNSAKLYARWAKPYLKAARDLEQRMAPNAALVTNFNTSLFELVLMGKSKYKPEGDVARGDLPKEILKDKKRDYFSVIILEFNFRTIPERMQQGGYGFRGKVEVKFTSYALNDKEIKVLKEMMEKDDLNNLIDKMGVSTDESLSELGKDIDYFLDEKKDDKKDEKPKQDDNPFSALFSGFSSIFNPKKREDSQEDKLSRKIKPDDHIEKIYRSQTIIESRGKCRKFYLSYKKAHAMPAHAPN